MPEPVMADIRMTEISYGSALAIEGYGPGFFRIGRHVLRGACLVWKGAVEDVPKHEGKLLQRVASCHDRA